MAPGFSTNTFLPAWSASKLNLANWSCLVAMKTISIDWSVLACRSWVSDYWVRGLWGSALALAAAGGTSPAVPGSSPSRTVSSNPPSKNGSTESLFGGISPIAKVENNNKRKRKTRKIKQSRKSQKQLKNRKHK